MYFYSRIIPYGQTLCPDPVLFDSNGRGLSNHDPNKWSKPRRRSMSKLIGTACSKQKLIHNGWPEPPQELHSNWQRLPDVSGTQRCSHAAQNIPIGPKMVWWYFNNLMPATSSGSIKCTWSHEQQRQQILHRQSITTRDVQRRGEHSAPGPNICWPSTLNYQLAGRRSTPSRYPCRRAWKDIILRVTNHQGETFLTVISELEKELLHASRLYKFLLDCGFLWL